MVADQVLQASLTAVQDALPRLGPHDRAVAATLLQNAPAKRQHLVDSFVASVRSQVQDEAAKAASAAPQEDFAPSGLSLLDEAEIAADVEMSRAIEAIKSVAEHELRELATFTSALAGDMDVSRDHNPFRAETYARALWSAAQILAPDAQVSLMRHGGMPLAQVLRKVYAASCARLESVGVEPAVYRTLILPSGSRTARPSESWQGRAPDMNQVREALPASAPKTDSSAAASPAHHRPAAKAEAQVYELMGRLFEAMLSDRRISRDIRSVLARLQPTVLRLVMAEPEALEDYGHPVWRFMDQTAHLAALQPGGSEGREQVLRLAEQVVESVAKVAQPDGELFRQGMGRLAADDRERLATRLHAAAEVVLSLQDIEDRLAAETQAGLPTGVGPLDTSQLETVPAELLDELPAAPSNDPDATHWLARRRPGDWVRLFSQGQWVRAQLLWQGRHGDAWLFGLGQSGQTLALRRRALDRLQAEHLLLPLRVRSMLRSAAVQLMRAAGKAPG